MTPAGRRDKQSFGPSHETTPTWAAQEGGKNLFEFAIQEGKNSAINPFLCTYGHPGLPVIALAVSARKHSGGLQWMGVATLLIDSPRSPSDNAYQNPIALPHAKGQSCPHSIRNILWL